MAQAQGSKRIYRNRDGANGADAVVWTVQPSCSVVKKNADGSVSNDMRVTAYKTVGSTTTTYDWANGIVVPGQPRPYYSIDGGSWTQCKPLSMDGGDGVMVKAYLGVTKSTLATVKTGIRFKLMYNGADVAFSPQLPVVKDGADGASINIRGHVIGHGFDEGEYGTWRENSNVTAEMRKKPFLVDNYGNSGVKTQVIHTPDGAMYGDIALYCETKENDAWVSDADGHLWVWTAEQWADRGQFKGEPGENGADGDKGDKGDDGADAVLWEVKASVGYLKVEKGYTFSRDIVVSGYKTVGATKSSIDWLQYIDSEPTKSAQYRVDGGSWTACERLRQGAFLTGELGLSASKLNSLKPMKYVQFRMVYGGTVVATTPEIQLVGDGISVRGPQMWVNVADGFVFCDRTIGNEWLDMVVHNNVFYSCIQSHAKSSGNEPGTDGGAAYWKATEQQEIVATYLLLAQKALIENLVVSMLETSINGGSYIKIADGLMEVYGKPDSVGKKHKNIDFGIDDETGFAVLRFFDNNDVLRYDLGPHGLRQFSATPERWDDTILAPIGSSETDIVDDIEGWAYTGIPVDGSCVHYYTYVANTINGVPQGENNGKLYMQDKTSLVSGWFMRQEMHSVYSRKHGEAEWNVPIPPDITDANSDILVTVGAKALYYRTMYCYSNGVLTRAQNYYFTDKMI